MPYSIKQETKEKRTRTKFFIAGAVIFTAALAGTLAYILTTPKIQNTLVIIKDGEVVPGLNVDDILIVPGESSEYQITLKTRMKDNYNVYVAVSGQSSQLDSYITFSVNGDACSYESSISNALNKGYSKIGYKLIDEEVGLPLTVKYDFDEAITESMITPLTLSITFTIAH